MNSSSFETIAGVTVPATHIVQTAFEYARKRYEPYLFNHVVCGFRREAGRHSDQYPATVPI